MNLWLEMSRDEKHGGGSWRFKKCLWAPTHKNPRGKWPFWENLLRIEKDDIIFHLRGLTHHASILGFSIADSSGYETFESPPKPGQWGYSKSYYQVPLIDFHPFLEPILLASLFKEKQEELTEYFNINKLKPTQEKERIFFVIQNNKIQCLNGAYCTEISNDLAKIIFNLDLIDKPKNLINKQPIIDIREQYCEIATRIGQSKFSKYVKNNFNFQCCFPDCDVKDDLFLIGSHIARWSDIPSLRGEINNGLCFCLMHDKAFEKGLFTLNRENKIVINRAQCENNDWAMKNLIPFQGKRIKDSNILPSIKSLEYHWVRIKFKP